MQRVPQPSVNPALRELERHDFWPGFIAALIGIILTFCGARHLTDVDTVMAAPPGKRSWSKPFPSMACNTPIRLRRPRPREGMIPKRSNAGPDKTATTEAPTWKVRVDTAAKTPCPT